MVSAKSTSLDSPRSTAPQRRVTFADDLERHGDRTAVVAHDGRSVSYVELAGRADAVADRLGDSPRLVALAVRSDVASLVAYLGALRAGHVVVLVPADDPAAAQRILAGYDPDCVLTPWGEGVDIDERRRGSAHDLHPDLALLLSTSGSTGSPKLVRLSHANLDANALAIADYLGLGPDDRAAMTLPLHYCYGLSVVHSHLAVGASLLLGGGSVVDPCFWERFRTHGATSLAGVPHTFDLLDRVGFEEMELPTLRYVTQAGGRLAPDRVRRYAQLGRDRGWDLFVMYGQTEATARMAYLPPELALEVPGAVGRAVPGGRLEVRGPDEHGVGELVYTGPNVMLGHAHGPDDLSRGRDVHELLTGDLGRIDEHGLVHVVGRRSRFAKLFGLRLDLDEIERAAAPDGSVLCSSDDDVLALGVVAPADPDAIADAVRERVGLPRTSVVAVGYDELPLLSSGKPDRARVLADALAARARAGTDPFADELGSPVRGRVPGVRAVYSEVLRCDAVSDDDTFVGLGGDSLSYVEVAMLLEERLGVLPDHWHLARVGELEALEPLESTTRPFRTVEANVALRAAAIGLVVAGHAGISTLLGGAHLLLAVAGYNFARFRVGGSDWRLRPGLVSIARIVVPVLLWISMMFTWREPFSLPRMFLIDNVAGEGLWRYWFVEVLVQLLLVMTVVFASRPVRDLERRSPFGVAMGLLGIGLLLRFGLAPFGPPDEPMYRTDTLAWIFFAGWAAQRATTTAQRALVAAAALVAVTGFFDVSSRGLVVGAGLLALVWLPRLRVPAPLHRVLAVVAASSLWIFLTHFAVFPLVRPHVEPWVLFVVAFPIGILASALVDRAVVGFGRAVRERRRPEPSQGGIAAGSLADQSVSLAGG